MANWQAGDHAEIVSAPRGWTSLIGKRGEIIEASGHQVNMKLDGENGETHLPLQYFELRKLEVA